MKYSTFLKRTSFKIGFSGILILLVTFALASTIRATPAPFKNNSDLQENKIQENTGRFIGTMNNIVIFIRFSDQDEFTESFQFCEDFMNNPNELSVKSYYSENSGQKLTIQSHFFPSPDRTNNKINSYQSIHPRAYFEPYDQNNNPIGYKDMEGYEREDRLFKDAISFVKSDIEALNLDLDINQDGNIDNFSFILKKPADGTFSICLYPRLLQIDEGGPDLFIQGKKVWGGNAHTTEYLQIEQLGFFCHEMFHGFTGAPDIYNSNSIAFSPVGIWDLMGGGGGTIPPAHLLVYMKMKYGTWLESIPQITESGTYTLESISNNPLAAYEIPSPNSSHEKFIVEYRKPEGMFETGLNKRNAEHGLIIYRVDDRCFGGNMGPPYEVYVFRPLDGTHPEEGDPNKAGFAIENGKTMFNSETNPACVLNDGSDGNIYISNITSNQGETISFKVIIAPSANFSADITTGPFPLTVKFTENSTNLPTSFNWNFGDGTSSSESNPTHTFNTPGTYSVSLAVSNKAGEDKMGKTDFIVVKKKEQNISFTEPTEAKVNDVVELNATASSGLEVTYQIVSGEASLREDDKTITFNAVGNVQIKAKQTGNQEYYAAPEKEITVTVSEALGLNNISGNKILIYPNPVKSTLFLSTDKNYKVKLINILGKVILQKELENKSGFINMSSMPNGYYILNFIDENMNQFNRVIIKE